jgi:hypothetical protein
MFGDRGEVCRIDADHAVARLEYALKLPALSAAVEPGCQGVSRFFDCHDNRVRLVLTCLWMPSLVLVECVSIQSSAASLEPAESPQETRWTSRIPAFLLPARLRGWERLEESLAAAPSCEGDLVAGGVLAFHSLLAGGAIANMVWCNPHPRRQRPQAACVNAYRWLARIGRMCSVLPLQVKERQRIRCLSWTGSLP